MTAVLETHRPTAINEIPTPALLVDAEVVLRNVQRMAAYGRSHGLKLRPHTKTHKSRRLAILQRQAGAAGLTVAKAGEAAVMAEVAEDVLVAFPALDPARSRRLAELARERTIRVAVDSSFAVEALGSAGRTADSVVGVLVDLDVGLGRTGVQTAGASLELARVVDRHPHLRLDGIMCYPGHIGGGLQEQVHPLARVAAKLEEAIEMWRKDGLEAPIVSGGSTPTAFQSHLVSAYTEIRPGTYIFHDMNCVRGGYCQVSDCAARITCTVVSDAVPGQVVLDAGSKTLTSDPCATSPASGYGYIVEYPAAKITRLSEEHAQVDTTQCSGQPRVGERITVIPNHICPCVNLQDYLWWCQGPGAERVPIEARGALS
jgi:D-serine deaminase-like pyridoxal phosphate-dependent protein